MPPPSVVPTLHLLVGYVGAGKTTLARQLATDGAVRFTLDQWMLDLYDLTPYDDEYGARASRCKEVIWKVAADVLDAGIDVVLDWSQWSRDHRSHWSARGVDRGAQVLVHYIDTPLAESVRRVVARNAALARGTHRIDVEEMQRFAAEFFEAPIVDEGLTLVVHRDTVSSTPRDA